MIKNISVSILAISLYTSSFTNASGLNLESQGNLCEQSQVVLAYFNGVQTKQYTAQATLERLKAQYSTKTQNGDKVSYELMYNETEGVKDFIETFDQRFSEETIGDRWELFHQVIENRQDSWWGAITMAIPLLQKSASLVFEFAQRFVVDALTLVVNTSESAGKTYKEHEAKIDTHALEGKRFVMYAHSQGNLFANKAYDYAIKKLDPSSVGVVHVAPASPKLNGNHILVNQDLVINALRLTGSVPPNTDSIPLFVPLGNNHGRDVLGHGLNETYLNTNFVMASKIKAEVDRLFQTLKTPPAKAQTGFFNVTMTWDGYGDVDLHVKEPSGKNVYYLASRGDSGYLDVDNTYGYGPEHYYATCNAEDLQTGIYQVKLANYSGAVGRTARVQVSSNTLGVLDTKEFIMGAESRNVANITAFNVLVSKDVETGRFKAALAK